MVIETRKQITKPENPSSIVPIKFRCNYCRQFLGISRAQAGGVVDCPTCGRSIRVPLLDGTVQPMLDPELDLADSHLTRALDELAKLADAPIQNFVSPTLSSGSNQGGSDEGETENQIPQPLPEPIPIEMPLPPAPVIAPLPTNVTSNTALENGVATEAGLLAELASLSAGKLVNDQPESTVAEQLPTDRIRRSGFSPVATSIMVLLIFLAGMFSERFVRILENLPRMDVANAAAEKNVVDNLLTGRITYKTKEGESQPDRGARVLVFPLERSGEVKLSIIGFRPADVPSDQMVANAALKALGGSAASVDERGNFRLPLEAGSYRLLVISHFQPRDSSEFDPALGKLLSEYFDKHEDLLGQLQFHFSPLRIKGKDDVWDHSF